LALRDQKFKVNVNRLALDVQELPLLLTSPLLHKRQVEVLWPFSQGIRNGLLSRVDDVVAIFGGNAYMMCVCVRNELAGR
jgi:hypothetical protein